MNLFISKKSILSIAICVAALLALGFTLQAPIQHVFNPPVTKTQLFPMQSVDTMKQSRDEARQAGGSAYNSVIDTQMRLVAATGATHVAIDTPYDEEFIPVLAKWVASARAHGLSVWFRGNFSGWEGWFSYPKIGRDQHMLMLTAFIKNHPGLFKTGDAFTPCPECENGGPGDPRMKGDAAGYRQFLIDEYEVATNAFSAQGKKITVYVSMNADIARQIMTADSVRKLGGTILIDHYTSSATQFGSDVAAIAKQLKANVGIGEFGAPIPDLNGGMSESQQANYINTLFTALYNNVATVPVVNYWDLKGGTTQLVNDNNVPRAAYNVVKAYFTSPTVSGIVFNSLGERMSGVNVSVTGSNYSTVTDSDGFYQVFLPASYKSFNVTAAGYASTTIAFDGNLTTGTTTNIYLQPENMTLWYKIKEFFYKKYGW